MSHRGKRLHDDLLPVIMATLVGLVRLSTHIRVFSDHRNRAAREIPREESA